MKETFGILGALFLLCSSIPYIIALWKRTAKPHAFSWLLWSLINAIVFAAQLSDGAGPGAWTAGVTAFVNCGIAFWAWRYSGLDFTRSDWAVFLSALAAIPLWVATNDPLWSVVWVCIIDTLGFWPTIRKSWHLPHSEVLMTFVFGLFGFSCSLAALHNYSLTNMLYPGVVLATNTLFIAMLLQRRRALAVRA